MDFHVDKIITKKQRKAKREENLGSDLNTLKNIFLKSVFIFYLKEIHKIVCKLCILACVALSCVNLAFLNLLRIF